MTRSSLVPIIFAIAVGTPGSATMLAQGTPSLAGQWTLDRNASQFPREIGFNADFLSGNGPVPGAAPSGGRGRSRSGGQSPTPIARPESAEDATRVQRLTDEVRTPPATLTIVDTPAAVTITDDGGRSRTFHPTGKEELQHLDQVPLPATATWTAGRFIVVYQVEEGRQLRYIYSRTVSPPQLIVDVDFIERGVIDSVRRIYVPGSATESPAPAATASGSPMPAGPASADRVPAPAAPQQPGAELKGLTKIGVVVEGLSSQAAACGLNQGAIEAAVSKSLSDAGLTVLRNPDKEPYVYVDVVTSSVSPGLCVSRYDAFLYTYATAKLSYHDAPVLVQVSLLNRGGMSGGSPAAHADGVLKGLKEYVDQFASRIRDANK